MSCNLVSAHMHPADAHTLFQRALRVLEVLAAIAEPLQPWWNASNFLHPDTGLVACGPNLHWVPATACILLPYAFTVASHCHIRSTSSFLPMVADRSTHADHTPNFIHPHLQADLDPEGAPAVGTITCPLVTVLAVIVLSQSIQSVRYTLCSLR